MCGCVWGRQEMHASAVQRAYRRHLARAAYTRRVFEVADSKKVGCRLSDCIHVLLPLGNLLLATCHSWHSTCEHAAH